MTVQQTWILRIFLTEIGDLCIILCSWTLISVWRRAVKLERKVTFQTFCEFCGFFLLKSEIYAWFIHGFQYQFDSESWNGMFHLKHSADFSYLNRIYMYNLSMDSNIILTLKAGTECFRVQTFCGFCGFFLSDIYV